MALNKFFEDKVFFRFIERYYDFISSLDMIEDLWWRQHVQAQNVLKNSTKAKAIYNAETNQ